MGQREGWNGDQAQISGLGIWVDGATFQQIGNRRRGMFRGGGDGEKPYEVWERLVDLVIPSPLYDS